MKAFRNEEKDQQRNHVHAYSNPAGGGIKQNKIRHRYHRVLRNTLGTLITVAATAVLIAVLLLPVLQIYGSSMYPTTRRDRS